MNFENHLIPETKLAAELGIPRAAFTKWRSNGTLDEGSDWTRAGQEIVLTPEAVAKVRELVALGGADEIKEPETPAGTLVKVGRKQGPNLRILRCLKGGEMVSVRLTGVRVTNKQFVPGTELEVLPTEDGMWQYDGKGTRRKAM